MLFDDRRDTTDRTALANAALGAAPGGTSATSFLGYPGGLHARNDPVPVFRLGGGWRLERRERRRNGRGLQRRSEDHRRRPALPGHPFPRKQRRILLRPIHRTSARPQHSERNPPSRARRRPHLPSPTLDRSLIPRSPRLVPSAVPDSARAMDRGRNPSRFIGATFPGSKAPRTTAGPFPDRGVRSFALRWQPGPVRAGGRLDSFPVTASRFFRSGRVVIFTPYTKQALQRPEVREESAS